MITVNVLDITVNTQHFVNEENVDAYQINLFITKNDAVNNEI